jgi:hypothetical protein
MLVFAEKNNTAGWTKHSTKFFDKHSPKIGQIKSLKGYYCKDKYGILNARISITGTNGRIIMKGVCWGYMGEGPRGLLSILSKFLNPLEVKRFQNEIPKFPNKHGISSNNSPKIVKQFLIKNVESFADLKMF